MNALSKLAITASLTLAAISTTSCDGGGGGNNNNTPPPNVSSTVDDGGSSSSKGSSVGASGTFIDTRDNTEYKWVTIGTQTWMAENLIIAGGSESTCYGENGSNCGNYGRLYTWASAMGYDSDCNYESCPADMPKYQGVCPQGWHIPTLEEFQTLINYVINDDDCGYNCVGTHLKAKDGWSDYYSGNNTSGTDTYGFKALPGGYAENLMGVYFEYSDVGSVGRWWSVTEEYSYCAHALNLTSSTNVTAGCISKDKYFNIRCLEN